MKNLFFFALLCALASCGRQNLNYQNTNPNSNVYTTDQNTSPAPAPVPQQSTVQSQPVQDYSQQQAPPPQQRTYDDNSNYNNNVDYNSPTYQTFYDDLSPYGYWVNNPNYGYVWVPNVGPDFAPYYSNGQWVYTDYGWTWASDFSWGWAPFHYGRWFQDPMYGWMWVPGNEWSPAWVTWGQYSGYYCWAPVEPGITPYDGYRPPAQYWNYVPQQRVMEANVSNYTVNAYSPNYNTVNYNSVTVINNHHVSSQTVYNSGPQPNEVQQATGVPVRPVVISSSPKPVVTHAANTNQLNLYKPNITPATSKPSTPAKITPVQNLKPVPPPHHNAANGTPVIGVPLTPNTPAKPEPGNRPVQSEPVKPIGQPNPPAQNEGSGKQQSAPIQLQPIKPVQNGNQPVKVEPIPGQYGKPAGQPNPPAQNGESGRQQPAPIQLQPVKPVQNGNQPVKVQPAPNPSVKPVQPKPQPRPAPKPQPKPAPPKPVLQDKK